ncbi:MAG TPA: DUF5663 domain-containing protein [Candidatus Paceibacterota bacterium]|nr:DUF5663 domain-containing protein [Candidatus Paceibacterota bacterium]
MKKTDTNAMRDMLSLDELPVEQQEELLEELGELVAEGALLRAAERIPEDAKAEFGRLLDQDASEEEVAAFIETHVPDADSLVDETLADIRNDILAVTGASQD